MADELHTPNHRWYEPRNHIALAKEDFSKQWIFDSGIQKIDAWINSQPWGDSDAYAVAGFEPPFVADFKNEYYRIGGAVSTFDGALTHARTGNATMVDSDGLLKWAPHNLLTYSEQFDNAAWAKNSGVVVTLNDKVAPDGTSNMDTLSFSTTSTDRRYAAISSSMPFVSGETYRQTAWFRVSEGSEVIAIGSRGGHAVFGWLAFDTATNSSLGSYTLSVPYTSISLVECVEVESNLWRMTVQIVASYYLNNFLVNFGSTGQTASDLRLNGNGTSSVGIWGAHAYRSDLGGMVDNPDTGNSYVPTTSAARYLARRGNHVYNGSAWVDEGYLHESEARTNLLHTTDALVTQSYTVTAVPHTLHFTGTGTVTLSGASTAGPLVGTGTGENNRVSLTFTPTAASLTLTVSGTVTNAQLEVGSTPSSYIPNTAASGTVTRAADTLQIDAGEAPYSATAMSIQMDGTVTGDTYTTARWYLDASNAILQDIGSTDFTFTQEAAGVVDTVTGGSFTSGVNAPFNIASRHGSTFINGAVDGVALTANTTPTALPDLSATALQIGYTHMGNIGQVRLWADDLGNDGIEEAST